MTTDGRVNSLAALLRELFIEGGVHVLTSAPSQGSGADSASLAAMTLIAPSGDVVVKVSRGIRTDGPLWAAHLQDIRSRLAPLDALRSWMQSAEVWIVRGTVIAALISTAAAIADADGSWPERVLRIAVPGLAAELVRRYRRRLVVYLAGLFLRRLVFAKLGAAPAR